MSKKNGAKPSKDFVEQYVVGDIVLAKMRGFPAWPSKIVDPDTVPEDVAKEQPSFKKQIFYCVRFFPAGDHAWMLPKDLSKLKRHEIEAYINEPHKKNGDLLQGYRIALDPSTWESELEKRRVMVEEAKEAEEVDELEGEEEEEDEERSEKTKKRKRKSEAGDAEKKKRPAVRKPTDKASKPQKPRKNGAKSKSMVESEEEGEHADDAGPSKKASPPPAKKQKREKEEEQDHELEKDPEAIKVKDMRHKLQRAFLGKTVPKDEDMPGLDSLFTQVESFDMQIKYLQHSKIGKVMRHIAQLDSSKVPRDEEFKFKDRAQALVNKWHSTINRANGAAETKAAAVAPVKLTPTQPELGSVLAAPAPVELEVAKTGTEPREYQEPGATHSIVEATKQQQKLAPAETEGNTTMVESTLGDVPMPEITV